MSTFHTVSPYAMGDVCRRIGRDWMLVTAGRSPEEGGYGTMTASWGCLGELWNKPVAVCFIRPQRRTRVFVEASDRLTLSFFPDTYRDALRYCGTHSGGNKAAACGLTPLSLAGGETVGFAEADFMLICRKIYVSRMEEASFLDAELLSHYPEKDYHWVYVCEIEQALAADASPL